MKKYLAYIIFLLFFGVSFAQQITLDATSKEVDVNDSFSVIVSLVDAPQNWRVEITWIDQFEVLGQSTANTLQVINWERQQATELQLQLRAKDPWEYVVWPAFVQWRNDIASNLLELKITWEKLFVNWTPQWRNNATKTINSATTIQETLENLKPNEQILVEIDESLIDENWVPRWRVFVLWMLWLLWWGIKKTTWSTQSSVSSQDMLVWEDKSISLWSLPLLEDEKFFDKSLSRLSTRIQLETWKESIGLSPMQLQDVWKNDWYHWVDWEPIIEILDLIQAWLYQWDESIKQELYSLLQSL